MNGPASSLFVTNYGFFVTPAPTTTTPLLCAPPATTST